MSKYKTEPTKKKIAVKLQLFKTEFTDREFPDGEFLNRKFPNKNLLLVFSG